jgi:hypothetical protein
MTLIESSLKRHGVVCLKNTYLDEADLIRVAETFGDEIVILPKELSFNNKDPRFPQIARIGNILMDGSLKDSSREAIIWH